MSHVELGDRELALIGSLAKHIRLQVYEYREVERGWDKLIEDLNEIIELADSGLSVSLINCLYRSCKF